MIRVLFIVFSLLLFVFMLAAAGDMKTSEDFSPKPPPGRPLLELVPDSFDSRVCLTVSTAAVVSGIGLTAFSIHGTLSDLMEDVESADVQAGIIRTGVCLTGTALFTVIADFFLDRIRVSKDPISKE